MISRLTVTKNIELKYTFALMMKYLITLISGLLLWTHTETAAKKNQVLQLLPTDTLTGFIPFDKVEVIDLRKDKDIFGRSHAGMKKPEPELPEDSLAFKIKRHAEAMTAFCRDKGNQELLIVVRDLKIQENVPQLPLIATVYLRLTCYVGSPDHYYVAAVHDSIYEMYAGRKPGLLLAAVTSQLLSNTVGAAIDTTMQNKEVVKTRVQITEEEDAVKKQLPVYQQAYRPGVYYTYDEFKNNSPADTAFYHDRFLAGSEPMSKFYLKREKRKKHKDLSDTVCFAVFDGEKWYRPCSLNDFMEMKMVDGDFYYYAILPGLKLDDYTSMAAVGYPYGLIGGMVAGGISGALNAREKKKPATYTDALFRMRLNAGTGRGSKMERLR